MTDAAFKTEEFTMIYLDNAATTRVSEAAAREAVRVMRDVYGNP